MKTKRFYMGRRLPSAIPWIHGTAQTSKCYKNSWDVIVWITLPMFLIVPAAWIMSKVAIIYAEFHSNYYFQSHTNQNECFLLWLFIPKVILNMFRNQNGQKNVKIVGFTIIKCVWMDTKNLAGWKVIMLRHRAPGDLMDPGRPDPVRHQPPDF